MPIIGGPVSVLLIATALVAAVVVWFLRRRRHLRRHWITNYDAIDREQLDAAEREVRDLGIRQHPEDDFEGDDWGPGATRPRSPLEL